MLRLLSALVFTVGFLGIDGPAKARAQESGVAFHFYGAEDCPPCMAFKRSGLPIVIAAAENAGFRVAVNVITKTRDVATPGAFGDTDAILREAAKQLDAVYPPIFFVTRYGTVVSVHGSDWQRAQESAERESMRDSS
ncbi:MAG: hypothetical protein OXH76_05810 [Boseongicola sp.]|nr:hypothetical protein [Boseongicola sp.]